MRHLSLFVLLALHAAHRTLVVHLRVRTPAPRSLSAGLRGLDKRGPAMGAPRHTISIRPQRTDAGWGVMRDFVADGIPDGTTYSHVERPWYVKVYDASGCRYFCPACGEVTKSVPGPACKKCHCES